MRRNPETVRAFLMRTTALYSSVVQAPKPAVDFWGEAQSINVISKGRKGLRRVRMAV